MDERLPLSGFGGAVADAALLHSLYDLPEVEMLSRPRFRALVVGTRLNRLDLFQIHERRPRLAHLRFPDEPQFLSFPVDPGEPQAWDGIPVAFGMMAIHPPGSRARFQISGWSRWGLIACAPQDFSEWCRTLLDGALPVAGTTVIVAPRVSAMQVLLQIHSDAIRLAQDPDGVPIPHREEIARALEDELIQALMDCLQSGRYA